MTNIKKEKRILRHGRVRAKVEGTPERPRAAVFRSLKHTYVQFIDDASGVTLFSMDDRSLDTKVQKKSKAERAHILGKEAGGALLRKGVMSVVFDRGGFSYHGRVKAVAEGLREAGIKA